MDLNLSKRHKTPKILIGTPTADVKDYCWEEFYENVQALTYKNSDFFVADNSPNNDYTKKLRKLGVDVGKIKRKAKSNIQYICESHNSIRTKFLNGKYAYLLHLESDVIPPVDIIERLLLCDKSVVSAPYFIKEGKDSHLMLVEEEKGGDAIQNTRLMDENLDFKMVDGKVHRIHNAGLGCTLIHRSVMEKIEFRHDTDFYAHPDTFFAVDLKRHDIPAFVDTSILCKHRNSAWINF